MVDTLMALWNRGHSGRGIMLLFVFFTLCISISLLLVTVGSSWSSLFPFGQPSPHQSSMLSAADLTATVLVQSNMPTPTADTLLTPTELLPVASSTKIVGPCNLTPTIGRTASPSVFGSVTAQPGGGNKHPGRPTATPTVPRPPILHPTPTPQPTARPTTAPTPTVLARPIPRLGPTPIATSPGSISTETQWSTACLSDSLTSQVNGTVLAALERHLWLIVGGSALGTLLLSVALYRVGQTRKK